METDNSLSSDLFCIPKAKVPRTDNSKISSTKSNSAGRWCNPFGPGNESEFVDSVQTEDRAMHLLIKDDFLVEDEINIFQLTVISASDIQIEYQEFYERWGDIVKLVTERGWNPYIGNCKDSKFLFVLPPGYEVKGFCNAGQKEYLASGSFGDAYKCLVDAQYDDEAYALKIISLLKLNRGNQQISEVLFRESGLDIRDNLKSMRLKWAQTSFEQYKNWKEISQTNFKLSIVCWDLTKSMPKYNARDSVAWQKLIENCDQLSQHDVEKLFRLFSQIATTIRNHSFLETENQDLESEINFLVNSLVSELPIVLKCTINNLLRTDETVSDTLKNLIESDRFGLTDFLESLNFPELFWLEADLGNETDFCLKIQTPYRPQTLRDILHILENQHGNVIRDSWLRYEILSLIINLAYQIQSLHQIGIFHRDIKPNNIFLEEEVCENLDRSLKVNRVGNFKLFDYRITPISPHLGDFSITCRFPERSDSSSCVPHSRDVVSLTSNLGGLPYAAPEQLNSSDYNQSCDIYSLGMIWAELLLGQDGFRKFVEGDRRSKLCLQFYYDNEYAIISQMILKHPDSRPEIQQVIDALIDLETDLSSQPNLVADDNIINIFREPKDIWDCDPPTLSLQQLSFDLADSLHLMVTEGQIVEALSSPFLTSLYMKKKPSENSNIINNHYRL